MTPAAPLAPESDDVRRAIIGWAAGWTLGVPFTMAAFVAAGRDSPDPTAVLASLLATSCLALGLPAFFSARLGGSERPALEGAAWGILFFAAMVFVLGEVVFPAPLPEFNNVTTADILRRRELAEGFHYPPMAVRFVQGLSLFGCAAGLVSGVLSGRPRPTSIGQLGAAVVFGLTVALVLPVAAITSLIAVPIAGHLASMGQSGALEFAALIGGLAASAAVIGAAVGSVIELARRVLIARPPQPG